MIQSGAIVRPPYIYGEILSRSLAESPLSNLPSVGRFLSQGMVVGAFASFLFPVLGMLLHPENVYNHLLMSWLPLFLATGIAFGLFEGLFIWACSYIAGHGLNALARATVGLVVLAILSVICKRLYSDPHGLYDPYLQYWLRLVDFYSPVGVAYGQFIGSRFNPVNGLLRGTTPPRWLALNGITGVVLRVLVIYATMQATLILIWMTQQGTYPHGSIFMAIAVGHCVAAIVILFTRMPFWLLLLLALLINFPVVVLITDVLTHEIARNAVIVYLALWAAFLLPRVSVTPAVLSFLKKEIRYYLID